MRAGSLRVVALVAALNAAPALAQPRADAAFEAGQLDEAAALYGRALESGALEPAQLAHVHLRLAELAALASLDEEAARHLAAALALRPDAELSDRAPPSLAEGLARPAARVRVVLTSSTPEDPIEIAVRDAPAHLARTLAVRGSGGYARTLAYDGSPRTIHPAPEARPVEVRALDRHGNVVAVAGSVAPEPEPEPEPEPANTVEPPPMPAPAPEEETPLVESPWLWVAVGLVAAGVAVAIGVSASGERLVVGAPVVR